MINKKTRILGSVLALIFILLFAILPKEYDLLKSVFLIIGAILAFVMSIISEKEKNNYKK